MTSETPNSQQLPYATSSTGKTLAPFVPLGSGFMLLALGLLTIIFGRGDGDYSGRNSEANFLLDMAVVATGLGLVVVGIIVIFRALRKYDW